MAKQKKTSDTAPEGELRIEYMEVGELRRWPGNPKGHDIKLLDSGMKEFGYTSPFLLDEGSGRIVAGHGRLETLEAMKDRGEPAPRRIVVKDGKWYAPVVRGLKFKNVREAERYLISDNNTTMEGGWDNNALAKMISDFKPDDMLGTGFSERDLVQFVAITKNNDMLSKLKASKGADAVLDVVPVKTRIKPGQVWLLGDHRLMCGDSTSEDDMRTLMGTDVAKVMATDPPYGIDYSATKQGIPRSGFVDIQEKYGDMENDDLKGDGMKAFLDATFAAVKPFLAETAAAYVWHPSGEMNHLFRQAMVDAGYLVHRHIVWVKPGFVLARSGMYHPQHETCFFGWPVGKTAPWYGEKNQTSVWQIGRDDGKAVHPTQKPVALFEAPMLNHTVPGDVCLEPFSGSGSQIIAGERLGRRVRAMEKNPRFAEAAMLRWEEFTGKKAVRAGGKASSKRKAAA